MQKVGKITNEGDSAGSIFMKFIIGKKLEMNRIWRGDKVIPVTLVQVGSCAVVQVKSRERDGYDAVQIGAGERKEKNIAKPQKAHMAGIGNFECLKEFRYDLEKIPEDKTEFESLKKGDRIDLATFAPGDVVEVTGTSKGKGFQGAVKRHGFHGHNTTHGTKDQVRMPGSIGAGEPQHVFKGTRMAGRMGNEQVTVKNLEVIGIDREAGTIAIKGGLPGARNGLVLISGRGPLTKSQPSAAEAAPEVPVVPVVSTAEPSAVEPSEAEPQVEVKAEASAEISQGAKTAQAEIQAPAEPAAKAAEVAIPEAKEPAKHEPAEAAEKEKDKVAPKAETPAAPEPSKAEPAVKEEKKVEPEKKKAEAAEKEAEAAEEKAEEPAKPKVEGFRDEYLEKFNQLPKLERDKLSSPEAMAAISELEEAYKVDLVSVLAKLLVKEITEESLDQYLIGQYKLEEAKAKEVASRIKDKVLHLVK